MKIFSVSDMHGRLDGLSPEGCDIVVIAGDFALLEAHGKWGMKDQREWVIEEFIPWINKYPDCEFVIVPGNHDLCFDPSKVAKFPGENWRINWPKNARVLIDSECEVKGLHIYGTPWVPIISYSWAFEAEHDTLKRKFAKIPENLDILITHTPPHIPDFAIDRSLQWGGDEAFGSSELADAILDKRPRNVFCGHIHTGTHGGVEFGGAKIYNVSRVDERYDIAYEPEVVDIDPIVKV